MVISRVMSDAGSNAIAGIKRQSDGKSNADAVNATQEKSWKFEEKPDPMVRAIVDASSSEKSRDTLEYNNLKKGILIDKRM